MKTTTTDSLRDIACVCKDQAEFFIIEVHVTAKQVKKNRSTFSRKIWILWIIFEAIEKQKRINCHRYFRKLILV